jgi:phospholipid/cholesterol/gamma-HCH transport system substrate-binding protein
MSRHKKNMKLKVGVFILFGALILFAYIILLGKNQTLFNLTSKYKVKFAQTDGLFTGSVVTVNGVPAGNVVAINFIHETGNVQTVISILRKFTSVITDQSEAALATKGFLGDKYIAITTKGHKGQRLPKGSYIPARTSSGVLDFFGNKKIGNKVAAVLDELVVVIRSLNSEKTVKKASKATNNVYNMFSESKSREISQILKRLNSILTKIDEGEGTAGAFINNKNLYNRVLGLLGQRPYHKYLPTLVQEKQENQKK